MGDKRIYCVSSKKVVEALGDRCDRCVVCGSRILVQERGNGFERRIACEDYENHKKKTPHKGYSAWFSGPDALDKAVDDWNKINK